MRFKNVKTGNIVRTEDKGTIALMLKSERYEKVEEKTAKRAAKKAAGDKIEDDKTEDTTD